MSKPDLESNLGLIHRALLANADMCAKKLNTHAANMSDDVFCQLSYDLLDSMNLAKEIEDKLNGR